MSEPNGRSKRIPEFQSVQEEAEFWDTHSTAEFEDDWEEAELVIAPDLHHVLSVEFDRAQFRRLSAYASRYGVTMTSVVRSWVLERLDQAEPEPDANRLHRASAD